MTEYIENAMKTAKYEILPDDKSFYAYLPDFQGVYANASTIEECRIQLREVLEDWLLISSMKES